MKEYRRQIIFLILLLNVLPPVKAQSFIGFLTENYAGINSVILNPANSVDSRFRADINLIGISAFGGNDYYNIDIFKAIKDENYYFYEASRYTPKSNNHGDANIDIMGPSFMFNINATNSIAIFTRARSNLNINGINGQGSYSIDNNDDFIVNQDEFNVFSQAWTEIGLSYARVLFNEKENFLKGGITFKHLKGGGSAYLIGRNISIDYDANGSPHSGGGTTGSITSTGEIVYGRFDDFENDDYEYELPKAASGLGVDIGIIYEWRPNYRDYRPRKVWPNRLTFKEQNKYKLKIGVSVTDIGYINYKNGIEDLFDITNTNVSEEAFENENSVYDALNTIYTLTNSSVGYKVILPTALHLNADWSFTNNFYLNFNTDISLIASTQLNASAITNMISFTPRYESKWFSFYMPLNLIQHTGFQAGAGLRLGPLYAGSSSVLTNLISKKSKGANFYAGLKIPLFHGKYDRGSNCNCN